MTNFVSAAPDAIARVYTPELDGSFSCQIHPIIAWRIHAHAAACSASPVFLFELPPGARAVPLCSDGAPDIPPTHQRAV